MHETTHVQGHEREGVGVPARHTAGRIWQVAGITGLLTSTFSTLFVLFGAHHIGREIALSFMEVGTVLLRDAGVLLQPTAREVVAGIVVHQCADISWAVLFFGLGARLTWQLRPAELLVLAPFWALATQAVEYHIILPWLQPLLRMQTPFWIGLSVHVASAAAYPLFYLVRARIAGPGEAPGVRYGRRTALVLTGVLGLLAGTEILSGLGHLPYAPLFGGEQASAFDRAFFRNMQLHHEVGVELAALAATQGTQEDVRLLGKLMVAEQQAEMVTQQRWWRNWFGGQVPPPTPEEHAAMPGMPPHGTLTELRTLSGKAFEERFLDVMIFHHNGAIRMANDAWVHAGDPRLRLFADQIRHAQIGQAERLRQWRYTLEAPSHSSR